MNWIKHENRDYTPNEKREIIFAAEQRANSDNLIWALLQIIEQGNFVELELKEIKEKMENKEGEYDDMVDFFKAKIKELEDQLI